MALYQFETRRGMKMNKIFRKEKAVISWIYIGGAIALYLYAWHSGLSPKGHIMYWATVLVVFVILRLILDLFRADMLMQFLLDLPKNLVSLKDPEGHYVLFVRQMMKDNQDNVKMQAFLARICASCAPAQSVSETLIRVLRRDDINPDVMNILLNNLKPGFGDWDIPTSMPIGAFAKLYLQSITHEGFAFRINNEDDKRIFFRRLDVLFIMAGRGGDVYHELGETVALYLKDYFGVNVRLPDAVKELFGSNFVQTQTLCIAANDVANFLSGLKDKASELTSENEISSKTQQALSDKFVIHAE
jgi:hypothetical protein